MMLKSLHSLRHQLVKLHVKHISYKKFADPKKDFVFEKLFKKEDLMKDFINKHLPSKDRAPVTSIEFLSTISTPPVEFKKLATFDVLCTDSTGYKFIVEMQKAREKDFYKRALNYTMKAYSNQLVNGGSLKHLEDVVSISIANFIIFPNEKDYVSTHCIMNTKTHVNDFKGIAIIIIELPKYDESTGKDEWCDLLKNAENYFNVKSTDPVIQEAYKCLETASWSKEEKYSYERYKIYELDCEAADLQLIIDSKLEAKIEVAKRMKAKNVDDETISEFTGLTVSEIKAL